MGGGPQLERRLALALHTQLHRRDRAVDRVVLAPAGIGVDPRHEPIAGRADLPCHDHALAAQLELAALGRLPHGPRTTADAVRAPVHVEAAVADPRRGEGPELDLAD